ncbi:MAG: FG-GAP-like repeat-containing protein, partial [Planctomycetota bacterium]
RYAGETLFRPRLLDVDGDGDLDVIGGRRAPGEGVVLLTNDGGPDLVVSSLGGLEGSHTVHPADVDLDGDVDLLFWAKRAFLGGSVGWLPQLSNGAFGPAVEIALPPLPTPYSECTDMAVADFNGDGAVDFVQTQSDVGFAIGSLAVGLNDGTGQFAVTVETLVAYMEDPIAIDVGVPDGDLDLIGRNFCDPVNGGPLNCAVNGRSPFVGTEYCAPAVPNGTGAPGAVQALGSRVVGMNFLRLRATDLPPFEFGFFLGSRGRDDVPVVPSSVGRLCVGGTSPIARFVRPGEVLNSGAPGAFELQVDLTDLPVPLVSPVLPGETLYFQAWHRDASSSPGSNFTSAVAVLFVP